MLTLTFGFVNMNLDDRWVFERSSGYAGYRCKVCGTWVYANRDKICDCNRVEQDEVSFGPEPDPEDTRDELHFGPE